MVSDSKWLEKKSKVLFIWAFPIENLLNWIRWEKSIPVIARLWLSMATNWGGGGPLMAFPVLCLAVKTFILGRFKCWQFWGIIETRTEQRVVSQSGPLSHFWGKINTSVRKSWGKLNLQTIWRNFGISSGSRPWHLDTNLANACNNSCSVILQFCRGLDKSMLVLLPHTQKSLVGRLIANARDRLLQHIGDLWSFWPHVLQKCKY